MMNSVPVKLRSSRPPIPGRQPLLSVQLSKEAVTVGAEVTPTVQAPSPLQPLAFQPAKIECGEAAAASVTDVPGSKGAVHDSPQSIPAGLEVTVPSPGPLPSLSTTSGSTPFARLS